MLAIAFSQMQEVFLAILLPRQTLIEDLQKQFHLHLQLVVGADHQVLLHPPQKDPWSLVLRKNVGSSEEYALVLSIPGSSFSKLLRFDLLPEAHALIFRMLLPCQSFLEVGELR